MKMRNRNDTWVACGIEDTLFGNNMEEHAITFLEEMAQKRDKELVEEIRQN